MHYEYVGNKDEYIKFIREFNVKTNSIDKFLKSLNTHLVHK